MNKLRIKKILKFILIFILVFTINYFITIATMDEIWTYGFSYNIANYLIPYKDFNMVILPFHSLVIGLLLRTISTSFLSYHIIMALIYSMFYYFISERITLRKTLYLILYLVMLETYFYNSFMALLLMMIILLETSEYKYKDLIIGLLIGYIMMTKVNIGAFLFLVFFFKSKDKLRVFLYSAIIPIFVLGYLILTNSLLPCIDYCLLGLLNFTKNYYIEYEYIILELIVIGYIIFKIIRTKDKNYYYILAFQIIFYPLLDLNHFVVSIYPLLFYLLMTLKQKNNILLTKLLIIIFSLPTLIAFRFMYKKYDSFIGYRNMYADNTEYFDKVKNYIKKEPNKKRFYLNSFAYFLRIDNKETITKYDLMNHGNMGTNEDYIIYEIDNLCLKEDCRILVDFYEYSLIDNQMPKKVKDFILDNYELCYDDFVYCRKINYCPKERE